jgi:hydrogenase/urease accessory protein HupE
MLSLRSGAGTLALLNLMMLALSRWWLAAAVLFSASAALAHDPFEITADVRIVPSALEVKVTMSAGTAMALVKKDLPEGTRLTPENFPTHRARLAASGGNIFEVQAGQTPLALLSSDAILTVENDVEFQLKYAAPSESPLRFHALHVERLGYGYGATVMVLDSKGAFLGSKLLMGDDTRFELPIAPGGGASAPAKPTVSFRSFFLLGIEHIITGYDHLLFLGGLLIAYRRFRPVAVVITCFTIAHSLTLALAALGLVTVAPSLVEPLIAASIVYVGIENLVRRGQEPKGRGWLTFAFGLIHGFGFAGILRETGLGQNGAELALPLFAFNLGVEAGQIAIAAICIPLWWVLCRNKAVEKHGPVVLSAIVALAGVFWLLQRTVL